MRVCSLKSFSVALRGIEDVWIERELSLEQQTELHDIANGCQGVLDSLNTILERYQSLNSRHNDIGDKMRKAWKRWKWDQKDIEKFQNRIVAHTTLLNAFHGALHR
jgi:hypothetical protein